MIVRGERRGERRPRPEPIERVLVGAVAAVSSLGALFAGAHPTANRASDAVLVVSLAIGAVAAASIARATAWIVAAGIATVFAPGVWAIVAGAALVVGIVGAAVGDLPYRRAIGAIVGGLTVQAVLRLHLDRFGLSVVAAMLALAPLVVSSWSLAHRSTRARVRLASLVAAGAGLLIAASFGVTALRSRTTLEVGVQRAQEGLAASRAGDTERAGVLLAQANRAFEQAHRSFASWFARPASVLPVVGQHQRALDRLTAAGGDASGAAAVATARANVQSLTVRNGHLDLKRVADMAPPLASINAALHHAERTATEVDSPWLVSPLAHRLDVFAGSVQDAVDDAQTASQAVDVIPGLLGGRGDRLYFVAFTTPAESRDLGGFTGAYGLLRARRGKLSLVLTRRIQALNDAGRGRHLTDPSVFPARYRSLRLEDFWQNITGTSDFPTVAEAVRQMWPQSGGGELDGVLSVDPYAIAALLKLTGPVSVEGRSEALTSENAAQFLLRDQYQTFKAIDERSDFLLTIARTVFKRLTTGDLPGPRTIADALAPVARQRRLLAHSFHPGEQRLFKRLGIDGAQPRVRGDFLSVRGSNLGQNKIDAFLHRTINDDVVIDPARGLVHATVTVTLRNAAPQAGLGSYVIGNRVGAPPGTNVCTLSIETPLQLRGAAVDGTPLAVGAADEYGRSVYTSRLEIPPRSEVKVRVELEGVVSLRSGYRLDLVPQPTVNPDEMHVRVRSAPGWRLSGHRPVGRIPARDSRLVFGLSR